MKKINADKNKVLTIDAYISVFPKKVQQLLQQCRKCIKKAAPTAEETISYGMPAFRLNGILVYFAAYKSHLGFYPSGSGIAAFKNEIQTYKHSKGAVQFPLDQPLPVDLITKMVKFRVAQDKAKSELKKSKVSAKNIPASTKTVDSNPKKNKELSEKGDTGSVSDFIKNLDPEIAAVVQFIRKTILSCDNRIAERIKWNNPSFFYTGVMKSFEPKEYKREIAVFNLFKGRIILVLPSGAKLKDTNGLLQGDYKDGRRVIIFKDLKDVKVKKLSLQNCIKKWIKLVDT